MWLARKLRWTLDTDGDTRQPLNFMNIFQRGRELIEETAFQRYNLEHVYLKATRKIFDFVTEPTPLKAILVQADTQ